MRVLSPKEFLKEMEERGHLVYTSQERPFNLNIVGIRNRIGRPNYYEDTISVYYLNEIGKWIVHHFLATTRPGLPSLLNPSNPKGAAILAAGQYVSAWHIGLHKGRYPALVQSEPVKVFRDNNKDAMFNKINPEWGLFGINIHKASFYSRVVGQDSAGCQVIRSASNYENFMDLCFEARKYWGNNFTYTLLEL